MFIKELGSNKETIQLIPNNEEMYITFSKKMGAIKFRFIGSIRFVASSLDKLVSNLKKEQMIHTRYMFLREEEFNLVARNGVIPYDYMNDWNKSRQ